MQQPRLYKIAERVIVLQKNSAGGVTPVTIYKEKRKKKKQQASIGMGVPEMMMDRMANARKMVMSGMKSMRKGGGMLGRMSSMGGKVFKAVRKGGKKFAIA